MIPLDATGFVEGDFFAPVSVADAQLRLVTQDGDGATSAVLGHLTALVYLRGDPSSRCPDAPTSAGVACGCSDYWTDCIDFAGVATVEEWRTARSAVTTDFKLLQYPDSEVTSPSHFLDDTDLFNGSPALAIEYGVGMYYAYDAQTSSFGGYSEFEQRLILTLPSGVNVIGPYTDDAGFMIVGYYTYGLTDGVSETGWIAIYVRDNSVWLVVVNYSDFSYQTPVLLGAAADWVGEPIQIGVSCVTSATTGSIDVVITKGVPCAASQPVVFEGTITVLDATEPMGIGAYDFLWDNS